VHSRRPAFRVVLLVALVALAYPSAPIGQQQEQQVDPPTTFRTGINAVRVDVIVDDQDGQPVEDLTEADFEVLEDGVLQSIDEFRMVRTGNSPPDGPRPPQIRTLLEEEFFAAEENVGVFLIYFQHSYIGARAILTMRTHRALLLDPLIRFVRSLDPADMVAVADPWVSIITSAAFTRDRDATIQSLREHFSEQVWERRELMALNQDVIIRNASRSFVRPLEEASIRLASLREARQTLIFVGSLPGGNNPQVQLEFNELVKLLKQNNTSVSVVDPAGLAASGGRGTGGVALCCGSSVIALANMRAITEETGGHAIVNTNEVGAGLARLASDARVYYLLTYTSPAPADGSFHSITVDVRRRDVRVRARSGYLALSPRELTRATAKPPDVEPAVRNALHALPVRPAEVSPITTWVGTERDGTGARVTLAWEPRTGSPTVRAESPRVTIEAKSAGGAVLFDGMSPSAPDATPSGTVRTIGGPYHVTFDSPPGQVDLRLTIESPDGLIDRDALTIDVPDYAVLSRPLVSTPRVFRARTAFEHRTLLANSDTAPTATRDFTRTDRLIIRFAVHGEFAPPTASLLDRQGKALHPITVTGSAGGDGYQMDLPLNHLARGEYLIAVEGIDERVLVPIRIN
jgi:VWFA-related protein